MLEPFLGKSKYANHGQRVVEGQRLMQSASDVLLGWIRTNGIDGVRRDYYVRQLWDGKGSAVIEAMEPSRWPPTRACAAGPWPGPTPGRATPPRSRATSAPGTPSTCPGAVRGGLRRPERAGPRRTRGGRRGGARQSDPGLSGG